MITMIFQHQRLAQLNESGNFNALKNCQSLTTGDHRTKKLCVRAMTSELLSWRQVIGTDFSCIKPKRCAAYRHENFQEFLLCFLLFLVLLCFLLFLVKILHNGFPFHDFFGFFDKISCFFVKSHSHALCLWCVDHMCTTFGSQTY